jgi:hypothetical protein
MAQALEAVDVGPEALRGVLPGLAGRDQEGPVTRLEEECLAASLAEVGDPVVIAALVRTGRATARDGLCLDEALEPLFGAVDDRPEPLGLVVPPGEVCAAQAPRAFGQLDGMRRWPLLQPARRGHQLQLRVGRQVAHDMPEPGHALEPPVAEELGVVGGDDERRLEARA